MLYVIGAFGLGFVAGTLFFMWVVLDKLPEAEDEPDHEFDAARPD